MPPRVIDTDVKAILETDLDTTPFIIAASLLVDQHLVPLGLLSTNLLTEIERWLAAHLACVRDPRFTQVRTDSMQANYQVGKPGEGLSSTQYGQTVLTLDTTGTLALVTTTRRASIKVF